MSSTSVHADNGEEETTTIMPVPWALFYQSEEPNPVNVAYRTYIPECKLLDIMDWYRDQLPKEEV